MPESFTASLKVDKNIVEVLSRSTYQRNFSYSLREMVSNAYDADATRVSITIDRRKNTLTIEDNGNGMSRDEFSYYLRIAGKKRGKPITSRFRRKRIGQFGVGFLSVFPFCHTLQVTTSTENSEEVLTATIPAAEFFARPFEQIDVEALKVKGFIYSEPRRIRDHFTTITLTGMTELALLSISNQRPKLPARQRRRTASIWHATPMERLRWQLRDELPIAFPEDSAYRKVFNYPESQIMQVEFENEPLYRNDVMGDLLESGEFKVAGVTCKYAICTPWKAIKPWEMRNVKIRLNNVGVGDRTEFDITTTRAYSRIAWLSGELHVVEGMDDLLSVSRDSFVESAPYNAVREHMADIFRKQANFVEEIEESRIAMAKQLSGAKQVTVAAKKAVIDKGVEKLLERGFTLQKVKTTRDGSDPVKVDRQKKVITVVENHPSFRDEITIRGKKYLLEFARMSESDQPCKFQGKRTIVVNIAFPLFQSRRYGEIFKRFYILSLVASTSTRSAASMFDFLLKEMETQFADYR
jgi:Histidine kinase-, DNA gyrase B-, and HSP90-like ATPase